MKRFSMRCRRPLDEAVPGDPGLVVGRHQVRPVDVEVLVVVGPHHLVDDLRQGVRRERAALHDELLGRRVVEAGDVAGGEALHLVAQVDVGVDDGQRLQDRLDPLGPGDGRVQLGRGQAVVEGTVGQHGDLERAGELQARLLLDVGLDGLGDMVPVGGGRGGRRLLGRRGRGGRPRGRRRRRGGRGGRGRARDGGSGARCGRSGRGGGGRRGLVDRRPEDRRALALVVAQELGDRVPGIAQPVSAEGDEVAVAGLLGHHDAVGREEGGDGQPEGPHQERTAGGRRRRRRRGRAPRTGGGGGAAGARARWRRCCDGLGPPVHHGRAFRRRGPRLLSRRR